MANELPNLGAHPDAVGMAKTRRRQIRSNSRDFLLARALSTPRDVDCTAGGTITLTLDQMWASGFLRLTGTPGVAFTLELADGNRDLTIENASGQTATIETATGASSPPDLLDGETFEITEHGTDITVSGTNGVEVDALMADGSINPSALIDFADNVIAKLELKDTAQTVTSPSSSAGTLTLDMEDGNAFEVTLTEDVTTLVLDNPPATGRSGTVFFIARQDGTGGHDITWPASVKWGKFADKLLLENGVESLLLEDGSGVLLLELASTQGQTLDADAVDIYLLITTNAGVTWYAFVLGLDMK